MNKIMVSKNFSLHEFECKDRSHLVKIDEELIEKLQKLRDMLGKPIIVNSGYRTSEYNKRIGGALKSQHMLGTAADIRVSKMAPSEVAKYAQQVGFRGIGIYDTFVHVDTRPNTARWDLRTRK